MDRASVLQTSSSKTSTARQSVYLPDLPMWRIHQITQFLEALLSDRMVQERAAPVLKETGLVLEEIELVLKGPDLQEEALLRKCLLINRAEGRVHMWVLVRFSLVFLTEYMMSASVRLSLYFYVTFIRIYVHYINFKMCLPEKRHLYLSYCMWRYYLHLKLSHRAHKESNSIN